MSAGATIDRALDEPRPSRSGGAWMLLLIALIGAVFGRAVGHQFVRFDDWSNFVENPNLHPVSWEHLRAIWSEGYLGLFAPVAYTAFSAEALVSAALGGAPGVEGNLRADVYHLVSLVLHVANTLAVFLSLRRLARPAAAACGAALFAVHPLQVESVCWATEQRGLLSHLPLLVAFFLVTGPAPANSAASPGAWRSLLTWRWLMATGLFVVALLAKPSAVALPLMVLVWKMVCERRTFGESLMVVLPWLAVAALWAAATSQLQPARYMTYVPPPWQRPLVAGDALVFYLGRLAVPLWLTCDYGRSLEWVTEWRWFYLSPLVPLGAAAAAWRWLPRRPTALAGGLFLAGLAPVLGLMPFAFQETSTVADRYLYLALLGPAAALALAVDAGGRGRVALALGAAALWAGLSAVQAGHWRDTASLAQWATTVCPSSPGAWHLEALVREYEQGDVPGTEVAMRRAWEVRPRSGWSAGKLAFFFARHQRIDEAISTSRKALWLDEKRIEVRRGLAKLYTDRGELGEALAQMRRVVDERPTNVVDRRSLAELFARAGALPEAAAEFGRVVDRWPLDADAWRKLASVREEQGDLTAALEAWQTAERLVPDHLPSQVRIADVLMRLGQADEGRRRFAQLLATHGEDVELRASWGIALVRGGRWAEAARQLEWVLRRRPRHARAQYHWGLVLAQQGDRAGAVEAYRRATEADSRLSEAAVALAVTLGELGRWAEAIEAYDVAIRQAPRNAQLRNNLGVMLVRVGRLDEARRRLQEALEIDPTFASPRENLAALEKLAPPTGRDLPASGAPTTSQPPVESTRDAGPLPEGSSP